MPYVEKNARVLNKERPPVNSHSSPTQHSSAGVCRHVQPRSSAVSR